MRLWIGGVWLLLVTWCILGCSKSSAPTPPVNEPIVAPVAAMRAKNIDESAKQDLRAVYELKERCGKDAFEWFRRIYGNGNTNSNGSSLTSTYENHFSAKENRCYALVTSISITKNATTKDSQIGDDRTLTDVNENKTTAEFMKFNNMAAPFGCSVDEVRCANLKEWQAAVKAHLDD